jgi:hypothetical protein
VHAENENARIRAHADEAPQELNPADARQMQVEQDKIGLLPLHKYQSFAPRCRVEDLNIWQRHEEAPQALAYDGVVVYDENFHDSTSVSGVTTGDCRGNLAATLAPLPST